MSKEKEKSATLKDLEEMGQAWEEKFQSLQREIGERSSLSNTEKSEKNGGETNTPLYKCKDGNCAFATDDLDAYIDHKIAHKSESKPTEEETPPAPKKRHESVDEFLNCPECRPRFDQRYLKDGWTPPKKEPEKKEEKPKRRGLF